MQYKAIVFDLDGTAIANRKDAMPSQYLIDTISKIKDDIDVSVATGRRIFECRSIFKSLELSSPCIILGGTQIIDPVSEKILWEKLMTEQIVKKIIDITKMFDYKLYASNDTLPTSASEKIIRGPENIIYIMNINQQDTAALLSKLNEIVEISA